MTDGRVTFDFEKLARTVRVAVNQLDRVIDLNFYPIATAQGVERALAARGPWADGVCRTCSSRCACRSTALRRGRCRSAFRRRSTSTRCRLRADLAAEHEGRIRRSPETRAARGELQFDAWDVQPADRGALGRAARARSGSTGLRNSLLIAIAPTATIASIAGCYECIEPQVSNLFKRETLSGDFLQVNRYLVAELKALGLWTEAMRCAARR